MKIITVIDSFPPEHVGGSEHVALNLSLGLQRHGHNVLVLTTTQKKENAGEGTYEGLKVIRLYFSYENTFLRSYLGVWNPLIKHRFLEVIKKERPDIVHFHNIHQYISYAAFKWVRMACSAKIFFTAHDVMSFAYTRLTHFIDPKHPTCETSYNYKMSVRLLWGQAGKAFNPFRNMLIRRYLKNADRTFTVSNAVAEAFIQNGISRVKTVYNGIDPSRLIISEEEVEQFKVKYGLKDRKTILFAGRGMSAKGLVQLIEALGIISEKIPSVLLLMAIEGSYAEHIKKIISEKILDKNAQVVGILKGQSWAAMFRSADVVVVPSIYFDPAPLVTMEAMAAGKPVVGTCFGGTPEIIKDGVTGFVVNPYDTKALSERILEFLSDAQKAEKFGQEGFSRFQGNFTIEHQVAATLQAYKE